MIADDEKGSNDGTFFPYFSATVDSASTRMVNNLAGNSAANPIDISRGSGPDDPIIMTVGPDADNPIVVGNRGDEAADLSSDMTQTEAENESTTAIRGVRTPKPSVAHGHVPSGRFPAPAAVPSSSTSSSKSPSRRSRKARQSGAISPPLSPVPNVSIDIAALPEEKDPELEKELEEIALTGRPGLISGTPAAYDLEKGRRSAAKAAKNKLGATQKRRFNKPVEQKKLPQKSGSVLQPSSKPVPAPAHPKGKMQNNQIEDEADKSWHGPIATVDSRPKNRRLRLVLVIVLLGLFILIGGLAYSLISTKRPTLVPPPTDDEPAVLSERQQFMHDVMESVTGPAILADPSTPQYKARRWLLFEDGELIDLEEDVVTQRFALVTFFFSTGGETSWGENNWLQGRECGVDFPWHGVGCHHGVIRTLALDNHALMGTIPPELGHVSSLENLILKNNPNLSGWIPTTLRRLTNLVQLGLYRNSLSGVMPDIFEHTKMLKFVNLEGNNLIGSIPLTIKHLSNLHTLALGNNKLEGVVPIDQLAETSIRYLGLSHNKFSSIIERSIKNMEMLEFLYLDHNAMRGKIPVTIGDLSHLKSLDVTNNNLIGTVPTEIGRLRRLEFLSVAQNQIKGTLPRQMGLMVNLKTLNVAGNQLTGKVPNISNMIHLVNLHLQENGFTGTVPEAIQQLQSIQVLFLSSNQFSGVIPAGLHRLSRTLRGLYLSDNRFDGAVPDELCMLEQIEALFLDTNSLTGPIPECFGDLTNLQQLYLFQNALSGTIPDSLQELRHLIGLGLESNNLEGQVPEEVCGLVGDSSLDIWADCSDSNPTGSLLCPCCTVCCPSSECV